MADARLFPRSCKPLHERREVTLAITPISYRDWNRVYNCQCDLVLIFEDEDKSQIYEYEPDSPLLSPIDSFSFAEESHLMEVIPNLWIALIDDEVDIPMLRTHDGMSFTHVVQVSYSTPPGGAPLEPSDCRREEVCVQPLELVCPTDALHLYAELTVIKPSEPQAARDFLSLVLPHGSDKWWPEALRKDEKAELPQQLGGEQHAQGEWGIEAEVDQDTDPDVQFVVLAPDYGLDDLLLEESPVSLDDDNNDTNALIVAPTSRAVDVLFVLFCYLALLEDAAPEDLLKTDSHEPLLKDIMFGPWSAAYMELVAKLQLVGSIERCPIEV